jgi:hypothetical protein
MKIDANARLSPNGRRLLIDRIERDGWTVQAAAQAAGISERTAVHGRHGTRMTVARPSLCQMCPGSRRSRR